MKTHELNLHDALATARTLVRELAELDATEINVEANREGRAHRAVTNRTLRRLAHLAERLKSEIGEGYWDLADYDESRD